jgi:hypothetical protein
MSVDIRLPIGLLFVIVGALIAIFGFATTGSEMYRRSLGININVWSGLCLTAFGAIMLWLALRVRGTGGKRDVPEP